MTPWMNTKPLLKLIETGAGADQIEKAARLHRSATLDAYLAHTPAAVQATPNHQPSEQ